MKKVGVLAFMNKFEWRETIEDDVKFYRANYFGREWEMYWKLRSGEDEWTKISPMELADWQMLRDQLWKKYQRKRCPWKLIEKIDKTLEQLTAES